MMTSLLYGMSLHLHEIVMMAAMLTALIFKRDAIRHAGRFKTACVLLGVSMLSPFLIGLAMKPFDIERIMMGDIGWALILVPPGLTVASFLCLVFSLTEQESQL